MNLSKLEEFIVNRAPRHYAAEYAPSTYEQLVLFKPIVEAGLPLPVFNDGGLI